jgi:hypothetical protein
MAKSNSNRYKKLTIGGIITLSIIGIFFCMIIFLPFIDDALPSTKAKSLARRYGETMENIYDLTGRLINSSNELEASIYFPYQPWQNQQGVPYRVSIEKELRGNTAFIRTRVKIKSGDWRDEATDWTVDVNLKNDAVKMEKYYLSGERAILTQVHTVESKGRIAPHSTLLAEIRAKDKVLRAHAKSWDLPRNAAELSEYINFLKTIEGVDELKDPWGAPLHFTIRHNKLICSSAGEDKVFDTKDDIASSVKL